MLDSSLQIEQLHRIAALPDEGATTLPGAFYTAPDVFRAEAEGVLTQGWHCLGRVDEVSRPGDYLTAQVLDEPVLMVRDAGGTLRVLSNLCRHRAMPLAQGKGNTKRFLCPYHAWSYRLDGSLLRAPHMENSGFEPKACALPEFPVFEWNGFVYTCLAEGSAETPDLAALDDAIRPYRPEAYEVVHTEEEVWACNWKCLVENFMEGYHLSVVHPKTLRGYTPTELARKSVSGPDFTSYIAHYPDSIPPRGTGSPDLAPAMRHASHLFAIFPTQVVSISANLLVSLILRPLDENSVSVRWTMSVYPDDRDETLIRQRIALWQEVNREDREKLELLQRGLRSRHAAPGPLAGPDFEGTIRDFHLNLAHKLALGRQLKGSCSKTTAITKGG